MYELGGPLKLEDVPVPEIGPGEALAKVNVCGVGYTVSKTRKTRGIVPRIPGHEVAGEIVKIGENVTHIDVGDAVTVYYYLTCGTCRYCLSERETLCLNFRGNVGVEINGGYAEFIKLPAENFIRLPKEIPPLEASVIADAVATPWKVMNRRAQVKPMDDVLVIGAGGGVGIHAVAMAKLFGARVIAADLSDEKLEAARKAGADEVIHTQRNEIDKEIMRLTDNKGVEAAVDFVCITETMRAGINSLARSGKLVLMTAGNLEINTRPVGSRELEIIGSRYVTKHELKESIELVRRGLIRPIVTRTFSLEEAELAHEMVDAHKILGRAAIII